jgi:hypothetical protein
VIDEFTRECLVLKADRGITSADVIDSLANLFTMRGVPRHIRINHQRPHGCLGFKTPARVIHRVCGFRLSRGLGSSRTPGRLPWPNPIPEPSYPPVQGIQAGHLQHASGKRDRGAVAVFVTVSGE